MFNHVVVVGLGLIGGSVSKAIRRFDIAKKISGVDPNLKHLPLSVNHYVDQLHESINEQLLETADFLVLAQPVEQIIKMIQDLNDFNLPNRLLITDVGSIKKPMVDQANKKLKKCYVPAHPIAGSEKNGFDASCFDLFLGKNLILLPQPENSKETVQIVRHFWASMGAEVIQMEVRDHDRTYALTSHLPHLLAYLATFMLGEHQRDYLRHCGAGFKDFSRIAKSEPKLWAQIFAKNEYFVEIIDQFIDYLTHFRETIDQKDVQTLLKNLEFAQAVKRKIE